MGSAIGVVKHYFPKVVRVNDADKDSFVEVTKRDNSKGRILDHNACAFAVACKRIFNLDGVIISVSTAYLIKGDTAIRYHLPPSVSREVVSFDREAGFDEGTYMLKKPNKARRLGVQKGGKNSKSARGKPRFQHITGGVRTALGSVTLDV